TRITTLYKKTNKGVIISAHCTDAEKASIFAEAFFPPRPTSLPPLPDDEEPAPFPWCFTAPAPHQIQHCIDKTHPHKAPGSDRIPNIVLKKALRILIPLL
ncbi:hypothetical protein K439DRAFT_1297222, partial [Ramaria rubella]